MIRVAVLSLAVIAVTSSAFAQDDPRYALVASFPNPAVGFQWEMNDKFALRVEGSYSYRDQTTDDVDEVTSFTLSGTTSVISQRTHLESSSNTTSLAFAGLVTIHRNDHIRLYLAPRLVLAFTNQKTSATATMTGTLPPGVTFGRPVDDSYSREDSSSSIGGGLLFGASSNVFERVALFGEIGATYTHGDGPTSPTIIGSVTTSRTESDSTTTTFATRAVAGIMFRF